MQNEELDAPEQLLTPSEVAALFRVNPKTVTRWARAGKLTAIRTLGGHRRFKASEFREYLVPVDEASEGWLVGSGAQPRGGWGAAEARRVRAGGWVARLAGRRPAVVTPRGQAWGRGGAR